VPGQDYPESWDIDQRNESDEQDEVYQHESAALDDPQADRVAAARERGRAAARMLGTALKTAAEMAGDVPADAAVPADQFRKGMIVRHPEYGLGTIVAVSGPGTRRMVTVHFASTADDRRFVVDRSPLRPVKCP
jgi:hypothetical protein